MKMYWIAISVAVTTATLTATNALAQSYPSRPVRMIVAFPAGGPVDALGRIVAQRLGGVLGQQIVVENRGGADGLLGAEAVARAAPDGHMIYFASSGHAINASLYRKVPYDTVRDFAPIGRVGESPNLIAIHPSVPANTLGELMEFAKTKKGELNYGATSSPTHLATELMLGMAGAPMTRIPYKGAAPAMTALIAGDVQMVISGIGTLLPQAKAGKVKGIAVTGARRSGLAPDIPTASESGVPGYIATTWYMMLAPAGTPRPIIDRLNADLRKLIADPEVRAQLASQGIELTPSSPEECGEFLAAEVAKWEKVVKATGARID